MIEHLQSVLENKRLAVKKALKGNIRCAFFRFVADFLSAAEFRTEVDLLEEKLLKVPFGSKAELVLCHNDLCSGNMVYDAKSSKLNTRLWSSLRTTTEHFL